MLEDVPSDQVISPHGVLLLQFNTRSHDDRRSERCKLGLALLPVHFYERRHSGQSVRPYLSGGVAQECLAKAADLRFLVSMVVQWFATPDWIAA